MLRPTMSHAVNAAHLEELKSNYIDFLEAKAKSLEDTSASTAKDAKIEVLSGLASEFGIDENHGLYPDDINSKIADIKSSTAPNDNFIESAYEIAFGDNAINRDFSQDEVLAELRRFSDLAISESGN
jgi:hypothetical protein